MTSREDPGARENDRPENPAKPEGKTSHKRDEGAITLISQRKEFGTAFRTRYDELIFDLN
jgi:hypothetical protein